MPKADVGQQLICKLLHRWGNRIEEAGSGPDDSDFPISKAASSYPSNRRAKPTDVT